MLTLSSNMFPVLSGLKTECRGKSQHLHVACCQSNRLCRIQQQERMWSHMLACVTSTDTLFKLPVLQDKQYHSMKTPRASQHSDFKSSSGEGP